MKIGVLPGSRWLEVKEVSVFILKSGEFEISDIVAADRYK